MLTSTLAYINMSFMFIKFDYLYFRDYSISLLKYFGRAFLNTKMSMNHKQFQPLYTYIHSIIHTAC